VVLHSISLPTIQSFTGRTASGSCGGGILDCLLHRAVDIIWNTTLVCGFDCACCCVDAVHARKQGGRVVLRSRGLELEQSFPFDATRGTVFDQAALKRQEDGDELSFSQKMQVLTHLDGFVPKIDVSGGDPLSVTENYELLKEASRRFGRSQITLTATGAGLARYAPTEVSEFIGELNFTYDGTRDRPTDLRPATYASGNLAQAKQYAALGVATRAECPLSTQNCDASLLTQIYHDLHEAGIDKLLVMRLFPSGRGCQVAAATPTDAQHREAIDCLRNLEARYTTPKVKLQCALRHLDAPEAAVNPCDMVRESFGLMADGTLLASPWAVGPKGGPLHDVWVLGNLARTPLVDILRSERVMRFANRLDENRGHCKFQAFVSSTQEHPFDRMFDHSDPLYTSAVLQEAH
jgi:MoaA/NifB/PqqE/SkfB family radical SAM enzyme